MPIIEVPIASFSKENLEFDRITRRSQVETERLSGIKQFMSLATACYQERKDPILAVELFQAGVNYAVSKSAKASCLYLAGRILIETGQGLSTAEQDLYGVEYFTQGAGLVHLAAELNPSDEQIAALDQVLQDRLADFGLA